MYMLNLDNVGQYKGGLGEMPKIALEYAPAADDSLTNIAKQLLNNMYGVASTISGGSRNYTCVMPMIKNVKFNNPATIVFWKDGTKTVVKCGDGDIFDPEKGLAMAITKKALGNNGHYFETVKKWTEGYSEENSSE